MSIIKAGCLAGLLVFTGFAWAQTREEISKERDYLSQAAFDEFNDEMAGILFEWGEEAREYWGYDGDRVNRAEMLIGAIDAYAARNEFDVDELPASVRAVQMIALNMAGGKNDAGESFSETKALELYNDGIVYSGGGPPMDMRGEYQAILRGIWMDENARTNLDGLIGEEAPSDYALMLFGETRTPTLCEPGEAIIFSCPDEARDRYISVCASPDVSEADSWVQYRVGLPGDLEFSWPEVKQSGINRFELEEYRGGAELGFQNGEYNYSIMVDQFTDMAEIRASRQEKTVFTTMCRANYSDIGSVAGHLGRTPNSDRLSIIPMPMVEATSTACLEDQEVLWSCSDVSEAFTASACLSDFESGGFIGLRLKNGDETAYSAYPEGEGLPIHDDRLRIEVKDNEALIAFNENGQEEYYLSTGDVSAGEGNFTYWRGGTPRSSRDCTMTHLDKEKLSGYSLGLEPKPVLTYTPVSLAHRNFTSPPAQFDALITQLKTLEAEGYFKAGAGMEPLEALNGLSPKAYLMSIKADDFRCGADFGGICAGSDVEALQDETSFILGFADPNDYEALAAFQKLSFDLKTADEMDLAPLAFSFAKLDPAGTQVSKDGNEFCQARVEYADYDSAVESVSALVGRWYEIHGDEKAFDWSDLRGVMTRYNVRAEPSANAEIIGTLENEMAYFPTVNEVISDGDLGWRFVMLPDGKTGFIAVQNDNLLRIGNGDVVCGRLSGGEVKLTSVSFGGD